jgi:hypothetical protein
MTDDEVVFGPPSYGGFFPRDPSHPGVWLLEGMRRAIRRFGEAATPTAHPLDTFIPLFEALNWSAMIDDRLGEAPNDSDILKGIRFARNVVHHQWADALQFEPGAELGVLMLDVSRLDTASRWVWRDEAQLPRSRSGRHGQAEYIAALQGSEVRGTLIEVLGELARKLPPPNGDSDDDTQQIEPV